MARASFWEDGEKQGVGGMGENRWCELESIYIIVRTMASDHHWIPDIVDDLKKATGGRRKVWYIRPVNGTWL